MGTILFILLVLVEVYYTVRCIQTKQVQMKFRQYQYVTIFFVFLLLSLTGVIKWGFQYYLFGIIYLIRAIIGGIRIYKKHYPKKKFSNIRMILKGVGNVFSIFFLLILAMLFPQQEEIPTTGKYQVATATYTYTDENRMDPYAKNGANRFVNVEFWYPKDVNESCPLLLFSHGSFGIKLSNESCYRNLASNGYVVCSIDHPYHSFFTQSEDGTITLMNQSFVQSIIDMNSQEYDAKEQIELDNELVTIRVEDMEFVLDTIRSLTDIDSSDELYHMIDCSKIGAFGHSLGGAAAVELARQRTEIQAVVNLDGDLLGEYLGYENGHIILNEEPYPCALLNIWSETMMDLMEVDLKQDLYPIEYIAATAPVEYDIYLQGTNHFTLTDLSVTSPILCDLILGSVRSNTKATADARDTLVEMNQILLDFFDCYVKGEGVFTPIHEYKFD